jgi:dTDP-4-amino-4,6-dideoxy-D-galactose acyltransferase
VDKIYYTDKLWDTDYFGFKVAEITGSYSFSEMMHLLKFLKEHNYKLTYWKIDSADSQSIHTAQKHAIYKADERLIFLCNTAAIGYNKVSTEKYSGAANEQLIDLAIKSGTYSRFNTDKNFPVGLFENMYTIWIKKAASKQMAKEIFVARDKEKLKGMITVNSENTTAEIGLIAVHEDYRKTGIGKELVHTAQQWAKDNGYSTLQVITQQANVPACKLYTACGFTVLNTEIIYHIWL